MSFEFMCLKGLSFFEYYAIKCAKRHGFPVLSDFEFFTFENSTWFLFYSLIYDSWKKTQ